MPWVYMLSCVDDSSYVGSAHDLEVRLRSTRSEPLARTATRRPFELVWAQECERIDEAYLLERKIKGWRRDKRLALIDGRLDDLRQLAARGSDKPPPPPRQISSAWRTARRNSRRP